MTTTLHLDFDGHRLAYRVSGDGPALVVMSQYWRPEDDVRARLLADRWQVFQVTPVGYGRSDRVSGYAGEAMADQVLAVLDLHDVDRFAVWGYSAGGAMAACVARATGRTAGLVCGGYSLFDPFTSASVRRLERRLPAGHASRSLWRWVSTFDWVHEMQVLSCPALFYWGSADRQMASGLRRARDLSLPRVDFVELAGLDHGGCGAPEALEERVVPTVAAWLSRQIW